MEQYLYTPHRDTAYNDEDWEAMCSKAEEWLWENAPDDVVFYIEPNIYPPEGDENDPIPGHVVEVRGSFFDEFGEICTVAWKDLGELRQVPIGIRVLIVRAFEAAYLDAPDLMEES